MLNNIADYAAFVKAIHEAAASLTGGGGFALQI
jgi:hypothetical protein